MDTQLTGKIIALVVLGFFWIGRLAYSAFKGKRIKSNVLSEIVSGRFLISATVYLIFPIAIILNIYPASLLNVASVISIAQVFTGSFFSLFGLLFMISARVHRESDWGFMGDSAGDILFTKGIYSVTRHPYYIGAILVAAGVYIVLNSWLILSLLPTFIFVNNVIKKEDSFLKNQFGDLWIEYSRKVGILPWFK